MATYDKLVWYQGRKLPAMELNEFQEDAINRSKDIMSFLYGKNKLAQSVQTTTATNAVTVTSANVWINSRFYQISNMTQSNLFGSSSNQSGTLYIKMSETLVTASTDSSLYAPTLQGVPTADRIQYTFSLGFTTGSVPSDVTGQAAGNNVYYLAIASVSGNNAVSPTVNTSGYTVGQAADASTLQGWSLATGSTPSTVVGRDSNNNINAGTFTSTVAVGTAPFNITSTTKVANLNVDMVDGYHLNQGVQTTDSPTFGGVSIGRNNRYNFGNYGVVQENNVGQHLFQSNAYTDSSGAIKNISGTAFSGAIGVMTMAGAVLSFGTATGLSTAGTTATLTNQFVVDGTNSKVVSKNTTLDDGAGNATFRTVTSNVTTGTAPFTVTSTTKVANLNADMVDGYNFDQSLKTTDSPTFAGITFGNTINSNASSGDRGYKINGNFVLSYMGGWSTTKLFLNTYNNAGSPTPTYADGVESYGNFEATGSVKGTQFISSVTNGTAPFTVSSTTMVTNLNAQFVDGYSFDQSLKTTDSPTFAGLAVSVGGTGASITGTSGTAQVLNLKAGASLDQVYMGFYADSQAQTTRSGYIGFGSTGTSQLTIKNEMTDGTLMLYASGAGKIMTTNTTLDDSAGNATFRTITSNVATGTAPFTVTSTTKVANLNADMVDGYSFNQSLQTTDSPTFASITTGGTITSGASVDLFLKGQNVHLQSLGASGNVTFRNSSSVDVATIANNGDATFRVITSNVTTGTAPFSISSTTVVTNLNADMVDGYHFNQSLKTTDSPTFAGATFNVSTGITVNSGTESAVYASSGVTINRSAIYFQSKTGSNGTVNILYNQDNTKGIIIDSTGVKTSSTTLDDYSGNATFRTVTSNVATGTAPFTVTSTTKVANLNADMVDGYSFNQSLQTTDSPTFANITVPSAGKVNYGGGAYRTVSSSTLLDIGGSSGYALGNNAGTTTIFKVDNSGNGKFYGKLSAMNRTAAGYYGVATVLVDTTKATIPSGGMGSVCSVSPSAGNHIVYVYVRMTVATTLTIDVSWYDDAGTLQTNRLINGNVGVGAWSAVPVYVNAGTAGSISVSANAGAANAGVISASIVGL